MHPLVPPCCTNLNDSVPFSMNEFDFDITRGCTSILANGVLHKYPNFKIIIPHSGGTMPMIAGRIKDPMAAILKFALPDHILFGTDYPFEPIESTVNELPNLRLSAQLMRTIERENAKRLWPRFKV